VAKKCGVVPEEETLDNVSLKQYLDMHKESLTENAMRAIIKLTEVAEEKKKKKEEGQEEEKSSTSGGGQEEGSDGEEKRVGSGWRLNLMPSRPPCSCVCFLMLVQVLLYFVQELWDILVSELCARAGYGDDAMCYFSSDYSGCCYEGEKEKLGDFVHFLVENLEGKKQKNF
jgi:hypothetical protein